MTRRALVVVVLGFLAACTESPPPRPPSRLLVVATIYPLYEFARHTAGDRADVVSLIPVGVEPHDWEPSPQDLLTLRRARVLVFNGAGLEPWVARVLAEIATPGIVAINTTEGIPLRRARETGPGQDPRPAGQDSAARAGADPHVWLDPRLARSQLEAIRAGLVRADPDNAPAYDENARAFAATLTALDQAFETGLRTCARREVVTSHAAFAYLTSRYGLTQVPLMGLAPESEPSPAHMAAIVRFARRHRVKYVFFETLVNPRLADALAREVGAGTLVLNPIEGLTKQQQADGKGYVTLMEENLQNLRIALECR
jgi:zinc transport system substrate-binding protein